MAVDVDRQLSWYISSHITFFFVFVFGLQSSVWKVFRTDLFDLPPVSSYCHVGLKPNMVVRLSLVRNIYIS